MTKISSSDRLFCEFVKAYAEQTGLKVSDAFSDPLSKKIAKKLDVDLSNIDMESCEVKRDPPLFKEAINWLENTKKAFE